MHVDHLAFLHTVGRTVHTLTVNTDVTVHHELTSLGNSASETSTQNQSVQTHFQKLNQCFTGQTGLFTSFLVSLEHLSLANTVLSTQTLLFLQTDRVVRVITTTSATVFTRWVWTAFKVLFSFRGQWKTQGTRQANLTA